VQPFSYIAPAKLSDAITAASQTDVMVIAGGTELLNWMKEGIVAPQRIIDLNLLPDLAEIIVDRSGLQMGALARMSDVAEHEAVKRDYPAVSQALLQSASPQIRNMASMGGNLLQRTRCPYFRAEVELPCNKRKPGSGCSAIEGEDRYAALIGASETCIATHPSDLAVALAALDATVHVEGAQGSRMIPVAELHRLPGDAPHHETVLDRSEIIVSIHVPSAAVARRSHYLKIRERASYEFALVSVAAGIDADDSYIREVRIALGGVAPRPWRLRAVSLCDPGALRSALDEDFSSAKPGRHNGFKIELAKRGVVRVLQTAGGEDE